MEEMEIDLSDIRREFKYGGLSRSEVPDDPFKLFDKWLNEAIDSKALEPTAVVVATVSKEGYPSSRTVLLKEVHENKFIFYTNYQSRKGHQIEGNPNVSLTFLWHLLERQVHVEGTIEKVPGEVSDAYFNKRSYTSRIGARISPQSQSIPSRTYIMEQFTKESLRLAGRKVPRPENWGGYAVTPRRMEFWQGRASRLHDRFLFERKEDGTWTINRIAP